jgi:flavin-dependent dehydrogenase
MHLKADACVGVAPVEAKGGRVNLTLVVNRGPGPEGGHVADFFRRHLRGFPALAPGVPSLCLEDGFLASGPFDVPTRSTVVNGAALVGDAAGYFDPFTGQGVFRAITGAELLAPVIAEALQAGRTDASALRPYARRLQALVAWPRRLQRLIDIVVTRPWLADPVISRLGKAPAVSDTLVSVTGDLLPVRALASYPLLMELLHPPLTSERTL